MPEAIATSSIARQAARLMEQSELANYGEGTALSTSLSDQYPIALDTLLAMHDWDFASKLVDLPLATAEIEDPDLPYTYKLPDDCVRLIAVKPDTVVWRADEDFVRADQSAPLRIRYTRRTDQEDRLPGVFKTAVAYELAVLLAPTFLRTTRRVESLERKAETKARAAIRSYNRQASSRRYDGGPEQNDWVSEATR